MSKFNPKPNTLKKKTKPKTFASFQLLLKVFLFHTHKSKCSNSKRVISLNIIKLFGFEMRASNKVHRVFDPCARNLSYICTYCTIQAERNQTRHMAWFVSARFQSKALLYCIEWNTQLLFTGCYFYCIVRKEIQRKNKQFFFIN